MPELPHIRVFIDSNVLFSATYKLDSPFRKLWELRGVAPVTSQYVVGEVARNIKRPAHLAEFENKLSRTEFVNDADHRFIPPTVDLVKKDRSILSAAIAASIDYLVTGDRNDFGKLYGTTVSHVTILSPKDFLLLHKDRAIL